MAAKAEDGVVGMRGAARSGALLAALLCARWEPAWALAGVLFVLLGIVIKVASKGYLRRWRRVITGGPYAYVRNPFYVGNLVLDCGLLLVAGIPEAVPAYAVMFFLLYSGTVRAEEKTLADLHGEEYEVYRRNVPRYIPRLLPWRGRGPASFRWKTVFAEKECSRGLRLAAYPLVIILRMALLPDVAGGAPVEFPQSALFLMAALAICLSLSARWVYATLERNREDPVRRVAALVVRYRLVAVALLGLVWFACTTAETETSAHWLTLAGGGPLLLAGAGVAMLGAGRTPEAAPDLLMFTGLGVMSELLWTIPIAALLAVTLGASQSCGGAGPRRTADRILLPMLLGVSLVAKELFSGGISLG